MLSNTRAEPLLRERLAVTSTAFVEIVVWRVPRPLPGSAHGFKYRLALVADGRCVLRYDNEAGKGDHKHVGEVEEPYRFVDVARFLADFRADVEDWRRGR